MPACAFASDAEEIVKSARTAAHDNRHEDAIAGFRQAIEIEPNRRHEWLTELADQLTWSQHLDEAIPLYREAAGLAQGDRHAERQARRGLAGALAWSGRHGEAISEYNRALELDPGNRELGLARAEALVWSDRLGPALAAYEAVLADHPGDTQALRGKARVLSWRGRYRAAVDVLQPVLREAPRDSEATIIAAESLNWMGRPDRAAALLDGHRASEPDDPRIAKLIEEIDRQSRPEARIDWRRFHQSDRLGISQLSLDQRIPFDSGRGYAGLRYAHTVYRPDSGPVEKIAVHRPSLYGGYRVSDAFELNAAIALDRIDTRGAQGDHALLTFEAYAAYRPNDTLRVDLGASRWTFDSEDTLRGGLTATQFAGSIDLRPDEIHTLSFRVSRTGYSDGNRRNWWQIEANRRLVDRPRIVAGYSYTAFDFSMPGQRGYYNPNRQNTHEVKLRGWGQFARRLRWDFRMAAGYETETPGMSRWSIGAGASLAYAFARNLEAEAAYDFSTSRTIASGGFERGIFRIGLKARF